jgi:hypothetical protein
MVRAAGSNSLRENPPSEKIALNAQGGKIAQKPEAPTPAKVAENPESRKLALLSTRAPTPPPLSPASGAPFESAATPNPPALIRRGLAAPILCQHDEGGSYPGGYCAITALRMLLRLESIADPGPDAVALEGSHPYIPGQGSSGELLAARARELGLAEASFTVSGSLESVKAELRRGHVVPAGGEGLFRGTNAAGTSERTHTYGGSGHWMLVVCYDARTQRFIINDPDQGQRYWVSESDFQHFFSGPEDGKIWMITY